MGCIRNYSLKNGDDRTIAFYIEEDLVFPISYGKQTAISHTHWDTKVILMAAWITLMCLYIYCDILGNFADGNSKHADTHLTACLRM